MFNLVLKDILLQKRTLLFSFLYIFFMIFCFQGIEEAMFSAGIVVFTFILVQTACAYEEKNSSDILLNSLPIEKWKIVFSKYLIALLYFILGTIVYFLLYEIINFLKLPIGVLPITIESFVGGFFAVGFFVSIYYPVFFKVGYIKSKILNIVIFFGIFSGGILVSNMVVFNKDTGILKDMLIFFSNKSDLVIVLSIFVVTVLLLIGSFILSLYFYKNRDF